MRSQRVHSSTLSHLFRPQTTVSLASRPNAASQVALPVFLGSGRNEMTRGSLFPRSEIDLHTPSVDQLRGHSSFLHTTDVVFLSAKTGKNNYTSITQVSFLDLLTGKETFLVYGGKHAHNRSVSIRSKIGLFELELNTLQITMSL